MYTWNLDKYAESSRFLLDNYRQASKIINSFPARIDEIKAQFGINDSSTFEDWRKEEKMYLATVKEEPLDTQIKINYLQTLIKLKQSE